MIKCDYAPCGIELNENSIKNFLLDSINENFSGFYCSHDHAGYDIIQSVFTNPTSFMTKAIAELGLTITADPVGGEAPSPPLQATIPQPQAVDTELDLITNVNQQVNNGQLAPVIAMNTITNEASIKAEATKLNMEMAKLIETILAASSNDEFPLGKNAMPDNYISQGVVLERMIYSIYCVDPSFTFNITYTNEFISFVFADDMYNFKITELDKVFSDVGLTSTSLYTKIKSIIKDVFSIPSPEPGVSVAVEAIEDDLVFEEAIQDAEKVEDF